MKKHKCIVLSVALSAALTCNVYAYTTPDVDAATRNYINQINEKNKPEITSENEVQQETPVQQTNNTTKLTIDGVEVKTDVSPIIVDGRTLVPLRVMLESIGATVDWNNDTQAITSTKGSDKIVLTIGNTKAYVNNDECLLDVPAQIINGRTMVPARFIAESMNYNVNWNASGNTVEITSYVDAANDPEAAKNIPGVPDGWVPCNFGTNSAAIKAIADGNAVYVNGQYWCSPQYANIIANETTVWTKDIAEGRPKQPVYDLLGPDTVVVPVDNKSDRAADKKALEEQLREQILNQAKQNNR